MDILFFLKSINEFHLMLVKNKLKYLNLKIFIHFKDQNTLHKNVLNNLFIY